MRAAAAENARQQQTKGSGRGGMMGVILPMYAVGIVVYLIYTLMKVCLYFTAHVMTYEVTCISDWVQQKPAYAVKEADLVLQILRMFAANI